MYGGSDDEGIIYNVPGGGGAGGPNNLRAAEFCNVWSATSPRPDGPGSVSSAGGEWAPGADGAGIESHTGAQGLGEDSLTFLLNLAMPLIVEWILRMISVILDGIESNDRLLGTVGDDQGGRRQGAGQ